VRFHDPQPKERMPALWSVCDSVLVHLKDSPVFATVIPSKLFEAMGAGRPVLFAGPDGEAPEIVRATGCGVWVPPEEPEALAEAVRELASNADRREALAQASAAAAELYSREHLAERMLSELAATTDGAAISGVPAAPSSELEHAQPESSEDAERSADSERAA